MSRKTTITGEGIRDETVDSADIASGSIKAGELSAQSISGQATITSTDTTNDRLLIFDATDSALKQVSIGNLGVTAGAAGSDGQIQYNNGGSAVGGAGTLIWDDTNSRLGVGAPSPSHLFTIESTSAFMAAARNTGTNSAGAVITVDNSRGGGNGVAEDFCGAVRFDANDSGGNNTQYAKISGMVHSPTDNAEIGKIVFETTTPLANKGTPLYLRGNAVHILSGGGVVSIDEANGDDVAFYVSGAIGSAGTTNRGTSLFGGDVSISGSIDCMGNLYVSQYIRHADDSDTHLNFTDNEINIKVGNLSFINLEKHGSAPHEITFNDGGNNIDFVIKGNGSNEGNPGFKFDGSNNRVGINGVGTPTVELDVDGDIKASGDLYADKIRRSSDSDTTTKILLNDELIKLYAGHSSDDIVRVGDTSIGDDNNFWVSGSISSRNTPTPGTSIFGGDLVVSGGLDVDGTTFVVNEDSNCVGIGTGTPAHPLTINGTESNSSDTFIHFTEDGSDRALIGVNTSNNILIENLYSNKHIVFKANDAGTSREGLRLDGSVPEVVVNQNSDSLINFRVESDNNTHMLFVTGSDKVGIGTATPTSTLHVAGETHLSSSSGTEVLRIAKADGDTREIVLENEGTDAASIYLNSAEHLFIRQENASNDLCLRIAATNAIRIDGSTSRVGIFNDSPAQTLDVTGIGQIGGLYVTGSAGLGIGTTSPAVALDVHHDPTSLADNTGGGEVVTFGTEDQTDTLAAGKLMLLDSNGVWKYTDANAPAASGGVLLAIALGTSVADGLLIRGFFDAATIQGSFIKGGVCYISEVAGTIDFTAPSGVGDTIRVVGYGTDTANVIYFNPSSTWIEL